MSILQIARSNQAVLEVEEGTTDPQYHEES